MRKCGDGVLAKFARQVGRTLVRGGGKTNDTAHQRELMAEAAVQPQLELSDGGAAVMF